MLKVRVCGEEKEREIEEGKAEHAEEENVKR